MTISTAVVPERKKSERGRPRSGTAHRPDLSAVEQILDAAAHLFVERGYAATSTRAIADEVGIRQASLYYHFSSKDQILEELLMRTVAPSMLFAAQLLSAPAEPTVQLRALISFDSGQLLAAAHNVGTLYSLPEIRSEQFEEFRLERARLRAVYASLISQSVTPAVRAELGPVNSARATSALRYICDVVFGMVESVIPIRADSPDEAAAVLVATIAQSCFRVLGHDADSIEEITAKAELLTLPD